MALGLPIGTRVLLTVLKKLFMQRGAGRQYGALFRGLSPEGREYVDPVLELIKREELAAPSRQTHNVVWIPDRSKANRAVRLVQSPQTSVDPLLDEAARLASRPRRRK